jgi:hypothetical protein
MTLGGGCGISCSLVPDTQGLSPCWAPSQAHRGRPGHPDTPVSVPRVGAEVVSILISRLRFPHITGAWVGEGRGRAHCSKGGAG